MDETAGVVGDLITEAMQLVDHRGRAARPETLALVRDQLAAASVSCPDGMLADDADDVRAQLDKVLGELERDRLPLAS